MHLHFALNDGWLFTDAADDAFLRGGCGGTYIRTTGQAGQAVLTLRHGQGGTVTIPFTVTRQEGERFD